MLILHLLFFKLLLTVYQYIKMGQENLSELKAYKKDCLKRIYIFFQGLPFRGQLKYSQPIFCAQLEACQCVSF